MASAVENLGETQGLPIMALGPLSHGLPAIHPLSLVREDTLPPLRLFRLVIRECKMMRVCDGGGKGRGMKDLARGNTV